MRDQVPRAALEHEAERIERAAHDARPLAVARAQPPLLPGRGGDRGQVRHRVLGTEPTAGVEMEVAPGAARALLELGRERGEHLQARVCENAAEAELRGRRRGDEERLRLFGGEARQLRAVAAREPVAARRAPHGFHGNAGRHQRLHVAVDRPHRDLEMRGELRRRELPSHLQEEEQRNEPRRPHRA